MATETATSIADGYRPAEEKPPLASYAAFSGAWVGGLAAALMAVRRSGRALPPPTAGDVMLVGTASHKLSRVIAKDKITTFLRAPFTEYQGPGGPAEVEERARGTGLRRALGELLICPYCLGLWFATVLELGLVFAPRVTRLVAATFTALTISDFLQIAYKAAEERGLQSSS
jgi:hypothetical protein